MLELQFPTHRRAGQALSPEQANPGLSNSVTKTAEQRPPPTAAAVVARPPSPRRPAPQVPAKPVAPEPSDLPARLVRGEEFKLSRAQAESFLDKNGRSAQHLVAGFVATYDGALLEEALKESPNDPLANLVGYCSALLGQEPPEARRQRLDAFKQAAPDHPLANYLSAFEHFQSGQADQAVQELEDAYAKRTFPDYRAGLYQNVEALYLQTGYSATDASSIAAATPLPFLSLLSRLGPQLSDLAGVYRQGGDEPSAQASIQIGLDLGERLAQLPDFPIANLTGVRLEQKLLQGLDPARAYGPSGLTVKDQLAALTQREQSLVELGQQNLSPEDRANGRLWFPPKTAAQRPQ